MVLLRPRWIAGHVLALVLTAAFVAAGFWQIARNHEANDKLAKEKSAFAASAPDIGTVDPSAGAATNERVSATGTYDRAHQSLLRGRSRGDKTGYDVLTPLRLANGDALIVDRGWVSLDRVVNGLGVAGAPAGRVTVRGRLQRAAPLRPGEQAKVEAGVTSLPRVDPARVIAGASYRLLPAYVEAEFQQPLPPTDAPALPEPKKTARVNHVSYAIQWFSFAAIAVIGWPIVLRRATRRAG
jgi:cytochrome oxidase assembly protein ShyY1